MNEVTSRYLNKKIGEITNRVFYAGESITITKHGRPVAMIVPIQEKEREKEKENSKRLAR